MHAGMIYIFVLFSRILAADDTPTEKDILNRLLNTTVYDSSIRPGSTQGQATRVEVDLDIKSLGPVNDINLEWSDNRLVYEDLNDSIIISHKRLASLWVPDLFFPQSRGEVRHDVTTPNVMIRLSPNGTIMYSQRISVTLRCHMDLSNFPMDTQTCLIDMESYTYSKELLFFDWSTRRSATLVQPEANIPDFTVTGTSPDNCSKVYSTGTFSCLRAIIHLRREIGFYATQTYVPSILIVVLSWASFWIDHEAVPARISVGLLTVLTITTQSSGALLQLPRVPYIKAIDVWMSSCLVFVFAAYMEFAVVVVLSRRYKKSKERQLKNLKKVSTSRWSNVHDINDMDNSNTPGSEVGSTLKDAGMYVDKLSRFGFPAAFLIFNLIYWIYYKNV